jgi:hypothetical protein
MNDDRDAFHDANGDAMVPYGTYEHHGVAFRYIGVNPADSTRGIIVWLEGPLMPQPDNLFDARGMLPR